jgi:serine phosphatase RsbU (regulator of sigma subunit)
VLVAYTDGLIELRGEAIDVSVERLHARVGALPATLDSEGMAELLLQDCLAGREPDDDVALVVVRRRPA